MDPIQAVANRAPMDWHKVRKGDYIDPEVIERMTDTKRTDAKQFAFAILNAKAVIEKELDRIGYPVVIKAEGDGLRLLTDAEAVEYSATRHRNLTTQLRRSHVRSVAAIDVRQLSAEQLRRHERDVIARSRELQAMRDARKQFQSAEQKQLKAG